MFYMCISLLCILYVYVCVWFSGFSFVVLFLQYWYCCFGLLTCKYCLPYNLYSVGRDVKPCSTSTYILYGLGTKIGLTPECGFAFSEFLPSFEDIFCQYYSITVVYAIVQVYYSKDYMVFTAIFTTVYYVLIIDCAHICMCLFIPPIFWERF